MEISTIGRPRNVGWVRAAALLYGDWGTSKAYVIGLALASIGFAALPHLLAVCALTALVGVNYIWICKYFPTGGGVYAAAGLHSRRLAMIGGLLLLADYIVTASLSCLDAFHYLGFNQIESKKWAITAIFAIGAVNFFGPKHSGAVAIWLALPTVLVVVALVAGGLPHLGEFKAVKPAGNFATNWVAFVGMILALSGVEAAASNTGVLQLDPEASFERPSVRRTSRRAVMVVMLEVVIGTALLSVIAMCLPSNAVEHKEDLLRYMGHVFLGEKFGLLAGWVFALLLLSAVNTALGGMVSLLYVMARDKEIPDQFTHLNKYGVPWSALIVATILPVIVLNVDDSVEGLAHLYAIGVVGAIAINVGSCAFARQLNLPRGERTTMVVTLGILVAVWITIAATKIFALLFVGVVLAIGVGIREYTQRRKRLAPAAPATAAAATAVASATPNPAARIPPFLGAKVLVAARGWTPALQFALEECRTRGLTLLVLYIREVAVQFEGLNADWRSDLEARVLFSRVLSEADGAKISPLYSASDSPADTIIDIAATFGVDTVILGGSKRATLVNLLKGNVVTRVAANLPEPMHLIVIG
jgi:L-asparagine transporter-like permease/nucleotide-binding universal stress UspA family protein